MSPVLQCSAVIDAEYHVPFGQSGAAASEATGYTTIVRGLPDRERVRDVSSRDRWVHETETLRIFTLGRRMCVDGTRENGMHLSAG